MTINPNQWMAVRDELASLPRDASDGERAAAAIMVMTADAPSQPDGWRPTSEAPEAPGTYINVRWSLTATFRWLAYKPDGARQMGRKGRWQRATEHGFVNEHLPEGEFVPNVEERVTS